MRGVNVPVLSAVILKSSVWATLLWDFSDQHVRSIII